MAEKVFKSAGVFATEIDLSRPTSTGPSGIPAGVIGTALDGPAFVPITVGSNSDFAAVFGNTDGEKFGPLAVYTFLQQASALTYLRVLGAGDGLKRDAGTGKVNRAGFLVGGNQVQNNGLVAKNPYAIEGSDGNYGVAGRTAFLGCFMSASAGSTVFDEAGITMPASSAATLTLTLGTHSNVVNNDTIILVDSHGVTLTATATSGAGAHDAGYSDSDYTVSAGGDITVALKTSGMGAAADLAQSIADMVNGAATHKSFGITTPVWTAGASVVLTGGTGAVGNTNTVTVTNVAGAFVTDFSAPVGLASGVAVTFSGGKGSAHPIIRGVILSPSGVIPQLSGANVGPVTGSSAKPSNIQAATGHGDAALNFLQGGATGSVNPATGDFVLLLNGHISTDSYPNVISASFKMGDNYFANKLNTDPTKLQEAGHLLYSHYDINDNFAVVTGSGITIPQCRPMSGAYATSTAIEDIGFILTGSQARNTATTDVSPNYESFQNRFTNAKSPFFISQDYGGTKHNLFRVHARGDGAAPSSKYKISIENIKPANEVATDKFGTFDLFVRDINDTDQLPQRLESHIGLTMDPSSEKYIGRVVGDQRVFFDFDQAPGSQKLVVEGNHAGNSSRIRVEIPRAVELGYVPDEALPMGFRGPDHLVTSGSGPLSSYQGANIGGPAGSDKSHKIYSTDNIWKRATVLPLRYRKDIRTSSTATTATIHSVTADSTLYWGVQFKMRTPDNLITNAFGTTELRSLNDAAASFDTSILTRTKYFPNFDPGNFKFSVGNNPGVADINGTVLDCDKFNNNVFTLERIRIKTGSSGNIADPLMWQSASYIRKGNITADKGMRALKVEDLRTSGNRTFAKFTTFLQGGFDGVNIFNHDQATLSTTACKREMDDSTNQGGTKGATVATYRKAVDIMGVKADVDINLLSIPGIRNAGVTDYAITAVENRFDALYVMDIEQRDEDNMVMTGSKDATGAMIIPSILNTASGFASRGLDSSFAAAYYPDITITDPTEGGTVTAPPSVGVMGVMAQNDKLGRPWFAPAGYTRGKLDPSIDGTSLSLERADLNRLYEVNINPLVSFAGENNSVVWGQKTLQANASALDRINVRRLLIDVRRKVKNIANSLLFEPNRQETLDKFNALVKPVMQTVQQQQGVDRFKVIIDTTTTTQADVENNTIRGKIYLQPTRTAEFISLDFTVTNAGNFDSV